MFVPSYSEVLVLWKGKPWLYVKNPCFHCRSKLEFLLFIQLSSGSNGIGLFIFYYLILRVVGNSGLEGVTGLTM